MGHLDFDTMIDCTRVKISIAQSAGSFKGLHFHPFFEIHFILAGIYKITTKDNIAQNEVLANAKDVIIVPPEIRHSITPAGGTGRYDRASFWVDIESIPKKSHEGFVSKAFSSVRTVTVIRDTTDSSLMLAKIKVELESRRLGYVECVRNTISNIIILLCRNLDGEGNNAPVREYSRKNIAISVKEYINANYGGECTLRNLAEDLHISEKHLNQLVQKFYSQSFTQLLLETRMTMANYFIKENDGIPFSEIAEKIGYSSVPAFYHAYNRFFGMTPNEYRKQCQRESIE